MPRFIAEETGLAGLKLVERQESADERGSFGRLFCANEMQAVGWSKPLAQSNMSRTRKAGVVRGLHFQFMPHAEMKFVACVSGKIFDVAVDLRRGSPTFLQWRGFELSADNKKSLLIPEGFAHGFQALSDDVEMIYFHSESYNKEASGALHVADPRLSISWPLPIAGLSTQDESAAFVSAAFEGIQL
jgi:dTDP-4-dehydrorhamnose 3,5-epimerase